MMRILNMKVYHYLKECTSIKHYQKYTENNNPISEKMLKNALDLQGKRQIGV